MTKMARMTAEERKVFVLSNLDRAIEFMDGVPEEQVDLTYFKNETECGTTACLAGWLCTDPYFAQWMRLVPRNSFEGVSKHKWMLDRADGPVIALGSASDRFDDIFGPWSGELFESGSFAGGPAGGENKSIAISRLVSQKRAVAQFTADELEARLRKLNYKQEEA